MGSTVLPFRGIMLPAGMILAMALIVLTSGLVPGAGGERSDPGDPPEWTVLVYMAADNNLESAAIKDFNEMESVGSTDEVTIIVQIDRSRGYDTTNGDWSGTRRYLVTRDHDREIINSELLDDTLGDLDMSDPENLADFLLWGVNTYPANRSLVILWDHGLGWSGGVLQDRSTYMSMGQLRQAFETVRAEWNNTFDIVGFDACLMGGIEVYHQLGGFANFSFGSGKNVPTDGLPYNDFIRDLVEDPFQTVEQLLGEIVHDYIRSYRDHSPISVHYAGIDLRQFDRVTEAIGPFVEEMTRQLPRYLSEVREAWNASEDYERNSGTRYYYFDFIDFLHKLEHHIDNPRLHEVSSTLRAALEDAIVRHMAWDAGKPNDTVRNSTGITVYLPDPFRGSTSVPRLGAYQDTAFATASRWDEFLVELFRYNDPDYRAERTRSLEVQWSMTVLDSDSDGQKDTFSLEYAISTAPGNGPGDDLLLEFMLVTAGGTVVHRENITSPDRNGTLAVMIGEYGFDDYGFHVFVWDANHSLLLDHYGYARDFQRYGVAFRITMDNGRGTEIEPTVIPIAPATNITLNLRVTNTGNSLKHFVISESGLPLKYSVEYTRDPFPVGPSETVVVSYTILALERVAGGTDSFHLTVRCMDNTTVEAMQTISLRVEAPSGTDGGGPPFDPYLLGFVPLLVFLLLLTRSGIRTRRMNRRMEATLARPIDPEIEELLNFTRDLVKSGSLSPGPQPPPGKNP